MEQKIFPVIFSDILWLSNQSLCENGLNEHDKEQKYGENIQLGGE